MAISTITVVQCDNSGRVEKCTTRSVQGFINESQKSVIIRALHSNGFRYVRAVFPSGIETYLILCAECVKHKRIYNKELRFDRVIEGVHPNSSVS